MSTYIISEHTATKLSNVPDALKADYAIRPASELNLDTLSTDVLMSFWFHYQRGRGYRELFPQGGKGTMRATWNLACYASNKATAISCRLNGQIQAANQYEDICDRIYNKLPAWAKGW